MPARLMAPKLVDADQLGVEHQPGTDQGPLCTSGTVMTEHTVAWRWARSVLAATAPGPPTEEPRSATSRCRRRNRAAGPPAKRTATLSDTSPGPGVTVRGTVVPPPPRQRGRRRARRTGVRRGGASSGAPSDPGSSRAPGRRSRCAPRRSGPGRRSRAGPPAHPCRRSGAAWPPSAAGGTGPPRRATTSPTERAGPCRCSRRRRTLAGAGGGQVEPLGQTGVDGRLARPRVEDEGIRPLAADAHVRPSRPPGRPPCSPSAAPSPRRRPGRVAPLQPAGGRRQGERDLGLDMHVGAPGPHSPAERRRQDEHQQR